MFLNLTNMLCIAARARRRRFLSQGGLLVRPDVLRAVHGYTDHNNRAAFSLLGYERRGQYVRERRTSGSGPYTQESGTEDSVEEIAENQPGPIAAEPISIIPYQDLPNLDIARFISGQSATTSGDTVEASTTSASTSSSSTADDRLSPGSFGEMVRITPLPLGGSQTVPPPPKQPAAPASAPIPQAPMAPQLAAPPAPPQQASPTWDAAAQALLATRARRPVLPSEDIPPSQKARTQPQPAAQITSQDPELFSPPLSYKNRHVTVEDRLGQNVEVAMACSRALMLPRDIAALRKRNAFTNVASILHNVMSVSVLFILKSCTFLQWTCNFALQMSLLFAECTESQRCP